MKFLDQRKPTCFRCEKGGFHCEGYAVPLHFRIAVPGGNQRLQRVVVQEKPPEELSLVAFKPTFCYAYLFDNFVWTTFGYRWLDLAASGKISITAQQASSALDRK